MKRHHVQPHPIWPEASTMGRAPTRSDRLNDWCQNHLHLSSLAVLAIALVILFVLSIIGYSQAIAAYSQLEQIVLEASSLENPSLADQRAELIGQGLAQLRSTSYLAHRFICIASITLTLTLIVAYHLLQDWRERHTRSKIHLLK